MKAAVYHGLKDWGAKAVVPRFNVEEVAVPDIGDYEVLVKVKACGICGTDVHKAINQTVKLPCVLGHEVAGNVVKIGSHVTKFTGGDTVVVPHHTPCFACHYCHHNHFTLCDQQLHHGMITGTSKQLAISEMIQPTIANMRPAGLIS